MATAKGTPKTAPLKAKAAPPAAKAAPAPKAAPAAPPKAAAPSSSGAGLKNKVERAADEVRADIGKVGGKIRGEIKSIRKK